MVLLGLGLSLGPRMLHVDLLFCASHCARSMIKCTQPTVEVAFVCSVGVSVEKFTSAW